MEPLTLSAAAIATLVITKAFEKTGEVLGEKALAQGGKLVTLLKQRFPRADAALARVESQPEYWGEAVLEVEAAAQQDAEVKATVEDIAHQLQSQPAIANVIKNIVKNNYGGNVGTVENDHRNQTFNF